MTNFYMSVIPPGTCTRFYPPIHDDVNDKNDDERYV